MGFKYVIEYFVLLLAGQWTALWQTSHKAAPGVSQERSRIKHYYESYAEANLLLASHPFPKVSLTIFNLGTHTFFLETSELRMDVIMSTLSSLHQ
jgi:hypothetical protein